MAAHPRHLDGFRFLLRYSDGREEWAYLRGLGCTGRLGDATAAKLLRAGAGHRMASAAATLLGLARDILRRDGYVEGICPTTGNMWQVRPLEIVTVEPVYAPSVSPPIPPGEAEGGVCAHVDPAAWLGEVL